MFWVDVAGWSWVHDNDNDGHRPRNDYGTPTSALYCIACETCINDPSAAQTEQNIWPQASRACTIIPQDITRPAKTHTETQGMSSRHGAGQPAELRSKSRQF